MISLASQLAEVERELALRRNVYPRMVATHKMKQAQADLHMKHMEAVRDKLLWLQKNEAAIKAALGKAAA